MSRTLFIGCIAAVGILFGLIMFRASTLTFVENYEVGIRFDALSGKISRIERTGWIFTTPFVVYTNTIDMRPMQVCIAANQRVLNCKLVKFNVEGLDKFLEWHGFYYDAQTRATGDNTELGEILKSYVFDGSGKPYPFVTVLKEMKAEDSKESAQPSQVTMPATGEAR